MTVRSWAAGGEQIPDFAALLASITAVVGRRAVVAVCDRRARRLLELRGAVGTPIAKTVNAKAIVPVGDANYVVIFSDFIRATRYAVDRGSFWGIGIEYDGASVSIGEDKDTPLGTIAPRD